MDATTILAMNMTAQILAGSVLFILGMVRGQLEARLAGHIYVNRATDADVNPRVSNQAL